MSYATATDLITRFSPDELAQRAAPEGLRVMGDLLQLTVAAGDRTTYSADEIAAADAALVRITGVLTDADSDIDAYLSERYTVPLDPAPRVLTRVACDLARYYLYDDAVDKDGVIAARYDAAIKMLASIAKGTLKLGDGESDDAVAPVSLPATRSSGRTFSQDSLGDYNGRFGAGRQIQ